MGLASGQEAIFGAGRFSRATSTSCSVHSTAGAPGRCGRRSWFGPRRLPPGATREPLCTLPTKWGLPLWLQDQCPRVGAAAATPLTQIWACGRHHGSRALAAKHWPGPPGRAMGRGNKKAPPLSLSCDGRCGNRRLSPFKSRGAAPGSGPRASQPAAQHQPITDARDFFLQIHQCRCLPGAALAF